MRYVTLLILFLVAGMVSAIGPSGGKHKRTVNIRSHTDNRAVLRLRRSNIYGDVIINQHLVADNRKWNRSFNIRKLLNKRGGNTQFTYRNQ